jgi:PAS domain S-box-containing protein
MMLRRRLTFPAAAIALALSLGLTGLGFWAGRVIVSTMSNQLILQMTKAVHRDVEVMMKASDMMLSRAINDIARHDIPLGDPAVLARELHGLLGDDPYVDWLFCGNEAGGAIDAGRLGDGTRVFTMTDGFRAGVMREYEASPDGQIGNLRKSGAEFDTRLKPWYTRARNTHEKYWTEPYLGSAEPILGMSLSTPVFGKGGAFAGVCGIDLILTQLSNVMQSLRLGDNGRAFIIDAAGLLIAGSGGVAPVAAGADGEEMRLHASEAADPIVRETARHLGRHPEIVEPLSTTGLQVFTVADAARGDIYAAVDRFEAPGGIAWTIVSALPASDFLGPVRHAAYFSIAVGIGIVALSLVLGLWAAGRALRPMTALTESAQAIAKGEWREVPEARRNDEIGLLAQAFSLMTARLKSTLEGLRRSEESYRTIFENALEGIARTTLDGEVLTANPALARILGYACPEEMIADKQKQFYVRPHERDAVMSALASKGAVVGFEAEFYRKDGRPIWVASSSRMVRDAAGKQVFVESFITDITERKRVEEALHQARADFAHAARLSVLGELVASIAHEVNQPLAAMRINGETGLRWLDRSEPNVPKARELMQRVLADAGRASDIIARIRAMAARRAPEQTALALDDIIEESLVFLRHEFQSKGVSVSLDLAPALPQVTGDRTQLQQVVVNLAINAVQAMAQSESVRRSIFIRTLLSDPEKVCCIIEDSGPGIDPAHLPHLFDSFFTTKDTGMGMGLPISRSIIEAHDGHIRGDNQSTLGGARFSFTLPANGAS